MATALKKMAEYVRGGPSFYSLAETSQDQYLALMIEEAARQGKAIKTEKQCWEG